MLPSPMPRPATGRPLRPRGDPALSASRARRPADRDLAAALSRAGGRSRWPTSRKATPIRASSRSPCSPSGAFVMRGAGCAYNDYVDREYDARVARTASRPIPSGQVTPENALLFAAALFARGLLHSDLVQPVHDPARHRLARHRRHLSVCMKRFTYWPQAVLGLAFNWGALMGWASVKGSLALPADPALPRLGAVDDRLRHHLRPSGRRGRPDAGLEVDGADVRRRTRRAGSADSMLGARRVVGRRRLSRRHASRLLLRRGARRACRWPGRSRRSTSTTPRTACAASARTATSARRSSSRSSLDMLLSWWAGLS